ncbi:MAG: ferredoxin:thioredoxin reductase [Candidatus Aenigmarchaeota archaeon]|nr:ferredoxin:thioredoxin reductase [Candidatus Aenigmarchaeota archaeon]
MNNKIEDLIKKSEDHAKKNGFRLNPDKKMIEVTIKGLIRNKEKFGEMYCPCRRVKGKPELDKKIICPCVYHKKEIEGQGHCHCFLFVK